MKIYLLSLMFLVSSIACTDSKVSPAGLSGDWQLTKITYGFPAPNSPRFTVDVPKESFSFDESTKTFKIFKDNILKESGTFELKEDLKNPNGKDIIEFKTDETFSNYSFPTSKNELVLYQRVKIGGILADGSSYHYTKILLE